jgi:hypothetical protein
MRASAATTLVVVQWLQSPPSSTAETIPFCQL